MGCCATVTEQPYYASRAPMHMTSNNTTKSYGATTKGPSYQNCSIPTNARKSWCPLIKSLYSSLFLVNDFLRSSISAVSSSTSCLNQAMSPSAHCLLLTTQKTSEVSVLVSVCFCLASPTSFSVSSSTSALFRRPFSSKNRRQPWLFLSEFASLRAFSLAVLMRATRRVSLQFAHSI